MRTHEWPKQVCFHEGRTIQEWLVEAVQEKLDRTGAGQPQDESSAAARLFGRQMAEFLEAVEGTPDAAFVDQIRELATVIVATRRHATPQINGANE